MNKPELGTKRVCASCGSRFFDLRRDPIICPKCEAVFVVPAPPPARPGRFVKTAAPLEPALAGSPEDLPDIDDEETVSPALDKEVDELTQEHLVDLE